MRLAPVSLHKDPTVPSVDPFMRYPVGMSPWRLFPPSRGPDVSVVFVAMVPGNPHIVRARPLIPVLDYSTRWPDANHNLARKSAEDQRSRKNQSDQ